jgi:hypothetical protein
VKTNSKRRILNQNEKYLMGNYEEFRIEIRRVACRG